MLFLTNRTPVEGIQTVIGRKWTFDFSNNGASNSLFFCERTAKDKYIEIGSAAFLQRLRESKHEQILLYIHGFSNLPEPAIFPTVTQLQNFFNQKKKNKVLVVPVIWPCDTDSSIVKAYWDDQKSADQSAFAFARALERFMAWRNSKEDNPQNDPCLKRINILAHSMGNRVFRQTLIAWNKYHLRAGVPLLFRNTFMVAADVVNESLHKGDPGELICQASRNVIVYFASDDLALRGSKVVNLKNIVASRRLGHTGPENMDLAPKNVYAVDCDDINTRYDPPVGHDYFRADETKNKPGLVFNHIYETIDSGRVFPDDELRRTIILKKS